MYINFVEGLFWILFEQLLNNYLQTLNAKWYYSDKTDVYFYYSNNKIIKIKKHVIVQYWNEQDGLKVNKKNFYKNSFATWVFLISIVEDVYKLLVF